AFPEAGAERALHCTLLLEMTLAQMETLAGAGPRAGFLSGRPSTGRVRAASQASREALDGAARSRLIREENRLQAQTLAAFDRDGNERLARDDELAEFNRHVQRCVEAYA